LSRETFERKAVVYRAEKHSKVKVVVYKAVRVVKRQRLKRERETIESEM